MSTSRRSCRLASSVVNVDVSSPGGVEEVDNKTKKRRTKNACVETGLTADNSSLPVPLPSSLCSPTSCTCFIDFPVNCHHPQHAGGDNTRDEAVAWRDVVNAALLRTLQHPAYAKHNPDGLIIPGIDPWCMCLSIVD